MTLHMHKTLYCVQPLYLQNFIAGIAEKNCKNSSIKQILR